MTTFAIYNLQVRKAVGFFGGNTRQDALVAMARHYGYSAYADRLENLEEDSAELDSHMAGFQIEAVLER